MIRSLCLFMLFAVCATTTPLVARAATFLPGDLVRTSSQPDVYYYGPTGKRYVFPNDKTYFTWYSDFSSVKLISNQELAGLPIGGAVTYRPGVRLIKLTTDPKVYAVAKQGTLRWVQTEAVATALYGVNWAKMVDDVPDTFFATYAIGTPITTATEYSAASEQNGSVSISADKNLTEPTTQTPNPTSTAPTAPTSTTDTQAPAISLSLAKSTVHPGDLANATASANDAAGIIKLDIYLDELLMKSCPSVSCSADLPIPVSGSKPSYLVKAIATTMDARFHTATSTLAVNTDASDLVTLKVTRSIVRQNDLAEAILESDISIAVLRSDIYIDGTSTKGCASAIRQCRWSDRLNGSIGTTYDIRGSVTDTLGRVYSTPHQTVTIGANDSPVLSTLLSKSNATTHETVDVTITGSDDDGVIKTEILEGSTVLKTCNGSATCTFTAGPWTTAGIVTLYGRATDGLGTNGTSSAMTIQVSP